MAVIRSLDYSDEYLYWDQTEEATVNLLKVWDTDTLAYVPAEYEEIVVKRVDQSEEFPEAVGASARSNVATFWVPAALTGGNRIYSGDKITIGTDVWVVNATVREVRRGGSFSFSICPCVLQV